MGTTQRISTGVTGDPNWRPLSAAITSVAKTVEEENSDNINTQNSNDDPRLDVAEDRLNGIKVRQDRAILRVFANLVKTGGGVNAIKGGRSKTFGKAGFRAAARFVGFVSQAHSEGLVNALREIGLPNLSGRSTRDVIDQLIVYFSDSSTGMDETASNKALGAMLDRLASETNNNFDEFELVVSNLLEGNNLATFLCEFFGMYVYEILSARFKEKIDQGRGLALSDTTFEIIKDYINGQVRVINEVRPVANIDWGNEAGKAEIETIFESLLNILTNGN